MADTRRHRGAHPQDAELFAPHRVASLRQAVADLSWLLSRGYAAPSSQKIVGDRYNLTVRQRIAVARSACSDASLALRRSLRQPLDRLAGETLAIDGYNLLITIESALAGGVILAGRDETYRDLASIHGSYRTMQETVPALELIGEFLARAGAGQARWLLDSPVSNSGRLRKVMLALAQRHQWDWTVTLAQNPDKELIGSDALVVSSDSVILDSCGRWVNIARGIVEHSVPGAWVVDLSGR